jgi:hypothetical protein
MANEYPYVAVRIIYISDYVRAYNPGDPVPASAVEGVDAWLKLGLDVVKRDGKTSK